MTACSPTAMRNTLADDGRYAPELALLSTRAIFGLWALWDTRYTDALMHLGRLHQDEKRGWFEGRYEANGGYNATFTLTTNTVVLEALLFKQNRGPLLQAPLNDGYLGVRMKTSSTGTGTVCRRSVYRSPARKEDDMGINYEELFNNSYSRITQEIKAIGSSPIFMRCLSAAPKTLARRAASLSGWKNRKSFIKPFSTCSRSPIPISWRITVQVTQEGSPQSLNLPPSIYALWRKAVLQTVRDLDPECDEDPDRTGHRAGAGAGIHAAAGRTASQSQRAIGAAGMNKLPLLSALNAPPIALAIYDAEERLSYWNRRVIEYYPGLESRLRVGLTLADVLRMMIDISYPALHDEAKKRMAAPCWPTTAGQIITKFDGSPIAPCISSTTGRPRAA